MAFADDLLELAQTIADLPAERHRQASLRRAVSTAHYALFHLLISEATLNWARAELRPTLGRLFDHGPMGAASINKEAEPNAFLNDHPGDSPDRTAAEYLRTVAKTFVQSQQRRIDSDYNMAKEITETEMLTQIESVTEAFRSWNAIRDSAAAQSYLLSLLGNKQRQEKKTTPAQKNKLPRKQKSPPADGSST